MISIQDLGLQILDNHPEKFYIFAGKEYGIKVSYLDKLKEFYGESENYNKFSDIFNLMNSKHLIPLKPKLYIIRYDDSFISSLDKSTEEMIKSINIVGTIVGIYEEDKAVTKLEKYLPDYVAEINTINPQFVYKYLKRDFQSLPDICITTAVQICVDYYQANNLCYELNRLPESVLNTITAQQICKLVGYQNITTSSELSTAIASRNFRNMVRFTDEYDEDLSSIYYIILRTMLEMDKIYNVKFSNSPLKQYSSIWTRKDIYYMFMQTYKQLSLVRSVSNYDVKNSLIYLYALTKYKEIPSIEDLEVL